MEKIIIRDATIEDSGFIAQCVMAAAGICDFAEDSVDQTSREVFNELCGMDHSLYCWNHARIAVDAETGCPAGCIIAYDGNRYARAREMTFGYFEERTGKKIEECDMETCKGEYYLDSLAVTPRYRGRSIGRMLIEDAVDKGYESGHRRFSLIADLNSEYLLDYYSEIGFSPEEPIVFFGTDYLRMILARD